MRELKPEDMYVDLFNKAEVEQVCKQLDCDERTLHRCVQYVGRSVICIEAFLSMNRDWITKEEEQD